MHAQRVDVFDEANGDHIVVSITDYFKLKLFPAEDRFLDQEPDLPMRCLQDLFTHTVFKLVYIINKTAAGTAHCIGRTKNNRVS